MLKTTINSVKKVLNSGGKLWKVFGLKSFLSIIVILVLTGCNKLPTPYVSVPFDIASEGKTAVLKFVIEEERGYPFLINTRKNINKDVKQISFTDEERLKHEEKPVKLEINRLEENGNITTILDKNFSNHKVRSYNNSKGERNYLIVIVPLKPGVYQSSITSLADINTYKPQDYEVEFAVSSRVAK